VTTDRAPRTRECSMSCYRRRVMSGSATSSVLSIGHAFVEISGAARPLWTWAGCRSQVSAHPGLLPTHLRCL